MSVHTSYAEEGADYELPELIVTASRIPSTFSELTRSVTVLDRRDIESGPARTIVDLLRYAAGLEMRQRGALGV
ncbi:MAG: TonB-dependent receptor, partial [Candidatus Latescibacteria bacterium]|nr:TonB-dependent receptor [Candidatus Latescibacterota bacterium]